MPATTTAVISGRALRDLAVLSRLPAEVHLVGSHGSEFDIDFVHDLTPAQKELHEKLRIELGALVDARPGVGLEVKPASVAVHGPPGKRRDRAGGLGCGARGAGAGGQG